MPNSWPSFSRLRTPTSTGRAAVSYTHLRVEWFTGGPLDLFHATDFVLAPTGARRKVLTVHDLAFIHYPNAALPSLHHYLNVVVPRSVRRADRVCLLYTSGVRQRLDGHCT